MSDPSATVAVVGASGFLGWHLRVLMRAKGHPEPRIITRADLTGPPDRLAGLLEGTDRVYHLAGACRGEPADVRDGNVTPAHHLDAAIRRCARPPAEVVYANSVQAGNGTPYGDAKQHAAALLRATVAATGGTLRDVALPNLFGEHGRPFHNSVVATFCRQLADGQPPTVHGDRELELLHATDAAAHLLDPDRPLAPCVRTGVRDLADRLGRFAAGYRGSTIPHLADRFDVRLFNAYRSHATGRHGLPRNRDGRGELYEAARTTGAGGQVFVSTTAPGQTRGQHFHLDKIERFVVLSGTAEIRLRRMLDDTVVRIRVSGDDPHAIDMPAKWAHSITNVGPDELLTLFWANEVFDPEHPDTFPEAVEPHR
ncbi:NAD-dependent epimerase/dehydratase family protein [Dactylosporangium sp. NBC_01737]|uniref:polysaccharide biosynthesis C-terminal domain-containing protein n=1 Tax=Dactylosporangium sp. NBC_01737 TaxID=2975959 RepID=UPI002E0EB885|nr:NAD-dependent epimerase/dehydratase family protein [Dactylosporangium sp. NBC_01737]